MWASRRAPLATRCLLFTIFFAGCAVVSHGRSASSLILGRTRSSQTTSEAPVKLEERIDEGVADEDAETTTMPPVNVTTKSPLTGNPNIDYKFDPNLPREINGIDLSEYPFFSTVPDNIDFNCNGLTDGFYASVLHKCQVYHHCLYGTRYDFLCANYTAFDQRTFICHFVSEVDCPNSPKFFSRNEALYKQDTTTTSSTTTTTTTPAPSQDNGRARGGNGGRRRRPHRRRPADYYYEDEDYDDDYEFYQEPRRGNGRRNKRPESGRNPRPSAPAEDEYDDPPPRPKAPATATEEPPLPTKPNRAVFEKPRSPPRIRPPVPSNERDKYLRPGEDAEPAPRNKPSRPSDSEYDDDYEDPPPPRKTKKPTPAPAEEDYATEEDFRRTPPLGASGRPLRRNRGPARRRPSRPYDDEDTDYRDEPPRRKRPSRRPDDDYEDYDDPPPRRKRPGRPSSDDVSPAGSLRSRSQVRPQQYSDDYDDHEMPSKSRQRKPSTTTTTTTTTERPRPINKRARRPTSTTAAPLDEEYYYDDESENVRHSSRSQQAKQERKQEVEPVEIVQAKTTAKPTTTTEVPHEEVSTERVRFVPRKTTPSPDAASKTTKVFSLYKTVEDTDESTYVFNLQDYIKPSTRAPFIPRTQKAPGPTVTSSTTTEIPLTLQSLPPRPAAFSPRPKPPSVIVPPVAPSAEEDYPVEEQVKPVSKTPDTNTRGPASRPAESDIEESRSRTQYNPFSSPTADYYSEPEIKPRNPSFLSRSKPSVPDFTSPAAEEPLPRGKLGTPPSDIASKSPGAPPPRSRLSTSFLPRGLSPVGGARSKVTSPPLLDLEDEEDDAINDALHPTGADASSTISSQRYSNNYQSRSRLPARAGPQTSAPPVRYITEPTTAASQTSYTLLPPHFDDYSDSSARGTSGSNTYRDQYRPASVPFPTTALDTFARQPSAPSSFRAAAAVRPQQFRESPSRRPVASASVQYSTQQEPSTSWVSSRDYFYTY